MPSYKKIKPWGFEEIWSKTEKFVGKRIVIHPNKRLSLQHHEIKSEAIYVLDDAAGHFYIEVHYPKRDKDFNIVSGFNIVKHKIPVGESFNIPSGTIHRFGNDHHTISAQVIEVSTPELDDVVRHEDDFGRVEK